MTTNFDVRVLKKYAIGFVAGLLLFWIFQQLFFSKDKDQPSGRNYKKEYIQSQLEINRLRKDSLEQRQEMQKEILGLREERNRFKTSLEKMDKHYEKLDFKAHSFDELDRIRDSVRTALRKEQQR